MGRPPTFSWSTLRLSSLICDTYFTIFFFLILVWLNVHIIDSFNFFFQLNAAMRVITILNITIEYFVYNVT